MRHNQRQDWINLQEKLKEKRVKSRRVFQPKIPYESLRKLLQGTQCKIFGPLSKKQLEALSLQQQEEAQWTVERLGKPKYLPDVKLKFYWEPGPLIIQEPEPKIIPHQEQETAESYQQSIEQKELDPFAIRFPLGWKWGIETKNGIVAPPLHPIYSRFNQGLQLFPKQIRKQRPGEIWLENSCIFWLAAGFPCVN